jgi:hypothetical protein
MPRNGPLAGRVRSSKHCRLPMGKPCTSADGADKHASVAWSSVTQPGRVLEARSVADRPQCPRCSGLRGASHEVWPARKHEAHWPGHSSFSADSEWLG